MKHTISIIILMISINGIAQIKSTSRLIEIGDSILVRTIGASYTDYYLLDTNSYYETNKLFKKRIKIRLIANEIVRGNFQLASIRYSINYPDFKELSSTLYLIVHSIDSVEVFITDIPDFIIDNRECDFVPRERIAEICDSLLTEDGIKIESYLQTDYKTKEFVWEINNIIRECTEGKFMDGEMEIIRINPYTGDILEHRISGYGYVF